MPPFKLYRLQLFIHTVSTQLLKLNESKEYENLQKKTQLFENQSMFCRCFTRRKKKRGIPKSVGFPEASRGVMSQLTA